MSHSQLRMHKKSDFMSRSLFSKEFAPINSIITIPIGHVKGLVALSQNNKNKWLKLCFR